MGCLGWGGLVFDDGWIFLKIISSLKFFIVAFLLLKYKEVFKALIDAPTGFKSLKTD